MLELLQKNIEKTFRAPHFVRGTTRIIMQDIPINCCFAHNSGSKTAPDMDNHVDNVDKSAVTHRIIFILCKTLVPEKYHHAGSLWGQKCQK